MIRLFMIRRLEKPTALRDREGAGAHQAIDSAAKAAESRRAMTLVHIDVNAALKWSVQQGKGGNWVAFCDPLGLTVQGETWAELMEDIGHTLDALLKDLLSTNELDKFLRDHRWTTLVAIPRRPEDVRFDVPFIPALMVG